MDSLDQFGIIFCKLFTLLDMEEKIELYRAILSSLGKDILEMFNSLVNKYKEQLATVPISDNLVETWNQIKRINGFEESIRLWKINLN